MKKDKKKDKGKNMKIMKDMENMGCPCIYRRKREMFLCIHEAAQKGDHKTIQSLLDSGLDINAQGVGVMTALHCAVEAGRVETVRFLLEKGTAINAEDQFLKTPLYIAVQKGFTLIAEILLQARASTGSFRKWSLLQAAAMTKNPLMVSLLRYYEPNLLHTSREGYKEVSVLDQVREMAKSEERTEAEEEVIMLIIGAYKRYIKEEHGDHGHRAGLMKKISEIEACLR